MALEAECIKDDYTMIIYLQSTPRFEVISNKQYALSKYQYMGNICLTNCKIKKNIEHWMKHSYHLYMCFCNTETGMQNEADNIYVLLHVNLFNNSLIYAHIIII